VRKGLVFSQPSLASFRWTEIFKQLLKGKCYNCFASDHKVQRCQDPTKCWKCKRFGHNSSRCSTRGKSGLHPCPPWAQGRLSRQQNLSSSPGQGCLPSPPILLCSSPHHSSRASQKQEFSTLSASTKLPKLVMEHRQSIGDGSLEPWS
jgi:hypothetical protein